MIYVGLGAMTYAGQDIGSRTVFKSDVEPTFETHGRSYIAVIGPFRTLRGARFMAEFGRANPHCQCVSDAERLGKIYAE